MYIHTVLNKGYLILTFVKIWYPYFITPGYYENERSY